MTLFIAVRNWKPLRHLSIRLWINKSWYIHLMGYLLLSNKNEQTAEAQRLISQTLC